RSRSSVSSSSSRNRSNLAGDGCSEFCKSSLNLFLCHLGQAVLDLELLRLQFGRELQPDVRHLLAHSSKYSLTVFLELLAEGVEIGLIDLIATAFRAARRIAALARFPRFEVIAPIRVHRCCLQCRSWSAQILIDLLSAGVIRVKNEL